MAASDTDPYKNPILRTIVPYGFSEFAKDKLQHSVSMNADPRLLGGYDMEEVKRLASVIEECFTAEGYPCHFMYSEPSTRLMGSVQDIIDRAIEDSDGEETPIPASKVLNVIALHFNFDGTLPSAAAINVIFAKISPSINRTNDR